MHHLLPSSCSKQIMLINDMRLAWEQHVYWTRMLLISIAARMPDEPHVTERLLQNPHDIARIFRRYYSAEIEKTIADLLTEHLILGAKIITALRDKQTDQAAELNCRWYANANQMANAFCGFNSHYDCMALRDMLYMHLDLTTKEIAARLAGDWAADIAAFDKVEQEALRMADYFMAGIMKAFPEAFV
ncbi:MAG: hypothetical protein FWE12_00040 [Oscillospiraceae bacterium]|nr:hypothetical protein [Oscillospiraceae bacterium]